MAPRGNSPARPFIGWSPPGPYKYKGNFGLPLAGSGVTERGFPGTVPGAGAGMVEWIGGIGGLLVKREISPVQPGTYQSGGTGAAQQVSVSGLTGGVYQASQFLVTALQQFTPSQPFNGSGPTPPAGASFSGG